MPLLSRLSIAAQQSQLAPQLLQLRATDMQRRLSASVSRVDDGPIEVEQTSNLTQRAVQQAQGKTRQGVTRRDERRETRRETIERQADNGRGVPLRLQLHLPATLPLHSPRLVGFCRHSRTRVRHSSKRGNLRAAGQRKSSGVAAGLSAAAAAECGWEQWLLRVYDSFLDCGFSTRCVDWFVLLSLLSIVRCSVSETG